MEVMNGRRVWNAVRKSHMGVDGVGMTGSRVGMRTHPCVGVGLVLSAWRSAWQYEVKLELGKAARLLEVVGVARKVGRWEGRGWVV